MEEKKETGIGFQGIFLTKLSFEAFPIKDPGKNMKIHFDIKNNFVPDTQQLQSNLSVKLDLINDEKNGEKTFTLEATVLGVFEEQPGSVVKLKDFAEIQAPALLFPYLREVISSTTAKSVVGPFIIPPMNVPVLLKANNEKKDLVKK